MKTLPAALCGYALDCLLGDPATLTPIHPVVWMGKGVRALEKALRERFPKTEPGELAAGAVMAASLNVGTVLSSSAILRLVRRKSPFAAFLLASVWSWQVLAAKNLRDEAKHVQDKLEHASLDAARQAVARIVGRDTAELSPEGVARAAIETVAENFSDGVIAPMAYLMLGGAPLALGYKAVNTMDSMVGYKNETYLYFGRAAAKLDDLVNYIPARLSALLLIAAARFMGEDAGNALRIWRRDRRNHASPNSGQCEAAAAGALHLRLCGPASYFGVRHDKPYIGDDDRPVTPGDIDRVCRMESAGTLLALVLFGGMKLIFGD